MSGSEEATPSDNGSRWRPTDLRVWSRRSESALAVFVRTETAGAIALLVGAAAALLWANIDGAGYARVWDTVLEVRLGRHAVSLRVLDWVNSGLMTLFFFVVGLEARRELDVGDLRERSRIVAPLLAGVGGMLGSIGIYLAVTAGSPGVHGWGAAMSTDTAFALGVLALIRPPFPERLRVFLLAVVIIDDIVALVVVATVYSGHVALTSLMVAVGLMVAMVLVAVSGLRRGAVYLALGLPAWVALQRSGIDPVVVGLVAGLLIYAAPAARVDLERATDLFRGFREQPTPELARAARRGLIVAVAPNERLEEMLHPWTSLIVVPVFALANVGIGISGSFLAHAFASRITWGITLAYVVGKPLGIVVVSAAVGRWSGGRLRPSVGWGSIMGSGTLAGMAFTVSLLVASLAFTGSHLQEAKLGILLASVLSAGLSWAVFRLVALLPTRARVQALLGVPADTTDLTLPVDPGRDHVRGPDDSPITLVEYGDFECPYCGQAEPVVRELLADFGEVRYVWRHLPLVDVHPRAKLAAIAAEAAGFQGSFWAMHDLLLDHQDALRSEDLVGYAGQLGLDVDRFAQDLRAHHGSSHIAEDVDSADLSGVSGTPTFFINGRRHRGAYDIGTMTEAIHLAKAQVLLNT